MNWSSVIKRVKRLPADFLILLIRLYQITLSPWLGKSCRYTPTCSNYGIEAIRKYGFFKGGWLTSSESCRATPGVAVATTQSRNALKGQLNLTQPQRSTTLGL